MGEKVTQFNWAFGALVFLLEAYLLYAVFHDRKKVSTTQDFFLHGESMSLGQFTSTLMSTNLSLGNMVYVCCILGFFAGFSGVFWSVMTIVLLGIGFWALAPRFKAYISERGNFGTLHDFLSTVHGENDPDSARRIKTIAASITAISLSLAIVIEAFLGALFLQLLIALPVHLLMILFIGLVAIYTSAAGFFTVVTTDRVQALLIIGAILGGIALFAALPSNGGLSAAGYEFSVTGMVTDIGWPTALGLSALGFFWLIATPDTWQRNAASRSLDTSIKGSWLGTALMSLSVAAFAFSGMFVGAQIEPLVAEADNLYRYSDGSYPLNDIFLIDIDEFGAVVQIGAALLAIGMLMAAISTIDTFFVVIGHVINVDLILSQQGHKSIAELPERTNKHVLQRGRTLIMLYVPVLFTIAILMLTFDWLNDPLNLFFVTYTIQFSVAIPLIAGTIPSLRHGPATILHLLVSSALTLALGIWGMQNLNTEARLMGLPATDFLPLLPVLPILLGLLVYAVVALLPRAPKLQESE